MTMLGRVLRHAVLLGLVLRIFLRAVHRGVRDDAGDRHAVSHMSTELDGVAFDLPCGAFVLG